MGKASTAAAGEVDAVGGRKEFPAGASEAMRPRDVALAGQ